MATSHKLKILYTFVFFLLFNGVFTEKNIKLSEDLIQERIGEPNYPKHFQAYIRNPSGSYNYTGFRSAFQWSIGKTIKNYGLHNAVEFQVRDLVTGNTRRDGEIGIYNNGSQMGVHFSFDSVTSSSPGPSFICSDNFTFYTGMHACFNSNYSLISNAIYFLDVEIRGKTLRGYISEPQRDLSDIDDPYVPRYLIGEIKWKNELTSLSTECYWVANNFGSSCDNLSEIITTNYAPEFYNKARRFRSSYSQHVQWTNKLCGPQNTQSYILRPPKEGSGRTIFIYMSRPSPAINETRILNF